MHTIYCWRSRYLKSPAFPECTEHCGATSLISDGLEASFLSKGSLVATSEPFQKVKLNNGLNYNGLVPLGSSFLGNNAKRSNEIRHPLKYCLAYGLVLNQGLAGAPIFALDLEKRQQMNASRLSSPLGLLPCSPSSSSSDGPPVTATHVPLPPPPTKTASPSTKGARNL